MSTAQGHMSRSVCPSEGFVPRGSLETRLDFRLSRVWLRSFPRAHFPKEWLVIEPTSRRSLRRWRHFRVRMLEYTWVIDQAFFSEDKHAIKERGQYPVILTEKAWSINDLLFRFSRDPAGRPERAR